MRENNFLTIHLNIKNPQSHVLLIYSCHWLEGISPWKQGQYQPRQPMNVK